MIKLESSHSRTSLPFSFREFRIIVKEPHALILVLEHLGRLEVAGDEGFKCEALSYLFNIKLIVVVSMVSTLASSET